MNTFFQQLRRVGLNSFFLLLIAAVALAGLFPFYGSHESPLPLAIITNYGVSVTFFFYGLRLSLQQLKEGLANWKLHLVVQCTTFILFPLIMLCFSFLLQSEEYKLMWLGAFYLAALPSTVSSSVVMVSIAGGNIPAAIFNASISSMIGIFITPLWMNTFLDETGSASEFADVILKLCLQVLAPVILGLLLNHRLGGFAGRYKNTLRYFDQSIILIIVFTAFSESFYGNMFANHSAVEIIVLGACMQLLFLGMMALMNFIAKHFQFSQEDRITILFCGSKKSLVQGAVMGRVLFPNPVTFGVILLPVMLYHALQLLSGSAIAQRIHSSIINNAITNKPMANDQE